MSAKDPIQTLIKRYKLDESEIIVTPEKKIIKKTGVIKIQKKENISYKIIDTKILLMSTSYGSEEGVFLIGVGYKKNSSGSIIDEIPCTASATPITCEFPFKMETAEARLRSRATLELAGLSEYLSEDELKIKGTFNYHPRQAVKGEEMIEAAIKKLG